VPIKNPIDALNSLNDAISKQSCIPKEPFVKLEENGKASILNYNLPQATCYDASSFVKMNVDAKKFKPAQTQVPANNFWDIQAVRTLDAIRVDLDTRVNAIPRQSLLADAGQLNARSVASTQVGANVANLRSVTREDFTADSLTDKAMVRPYLPAVEKDYLAVRIKQGYMPVPYRRFSGLMDIRYVTKPITPKPELTMVLHFKVCSYLGDYGAGQTIKTFSLLPGEKMEIGIKHYLRNEITKKQSQHILDSFSTSSAEELQHTVEAENTFTSSTTETESKEKNWNVGGNLGINAGPVSFGAQGGVGGSKTSSFSEAMQNQIKQLDSAISKHVAKADTLRQIDVNTESNTSSISEEEETIKRVIENYNKSRVINFVFRQLLQEFFTITYLNNVTFTYTNGYPESARSCSIADLETMLTELLVDDVAVQAEANKIYTYLCNIVDYTGTKQSFIELVKESNGNCINPTEPAMVTSYVRKRNDLSQTYKDKTVNRIILSTVHRITRTSSLIADAVLGQGEALDCFNQKLQDANAQNAYLGNLELVQKLSMIEEITDPVQRADEYKKVFGACCSTPQTQVIS
jgi:hypothetical protein